MSRFRAAYPPEFRRKMVELVRSGRTPEALSRKFEPTAQSLANWVRPADRDASKRVDDATTAQREELIRYLPDQDHGQHLQGLCVRLLRLARQARLHACDGRRQPHPQDPCGFARDLRRTAGPCRKMTSFEKFEEVCALARECGVSVRLLHSDKVSIIPLFGWYDYFFGEPGVELKTQWSDYFACKWQLHHEARLIASHLSAMNETLPSPTDKTASTFFHFPPRIDLLPRQIAERHRYLCLILGSDALGRQIRQSGASIHVYGHRHVNRMVTLKGITYVNNVFGYPTERSAKKLLCICYKELAIIGAAPTP